MFKKIRQLFCKHDYEYESDAPWCRVRAIYVCKKCGKVKLW